MRTFSVVLFFFLFFTNLQSQNTSTPVVSIIPRPVGLKVVDGSFKLDKNTVVIVPDAADEPSVDFLNKYLQEIYGFTLKRSRNPNNNCIIVATRKFIQPPENDEHYTLNGSSGKIIVTGDSYAGTFRGLQTLIQLLPVKRGAVLYLPLVMIDDKPEFKYRGLHLDVGRHFFNVSFVKKYIDFIALHKMNRFHWHLTEDQGWRIEIKKFPELTNTGAYRDGTIIGRYPGTGNDSVRYGGFYTQDEIREVVAYAAARHIEVIPEIEMPGHAMAALTAYPYLGCTGSGYKVQGTWGVFKDVFCAGNDSVFTFLEGVLDEVMTLFPSQYIHIGGDECPKDSWKVCPKCQKRIKDEGLKDEHGLQSYFIQRIEKYINGKGKKIIGWDEILEGGLAPNATVMSWRGEEGGIDAAKQNHQVIMTPGSYVYFDHAQSKHEDSVTIGGFLPIQKVYCYQPRPAVLDSTEKKKIIGAQANMWSEYMGNERKVEYMLFPRLAALSEVLWSPDKSKDWKNFEKRLHVQLKRYDLWKVNYSKAIFTDSKISDL